MVNKNNVSCSLKTHSSILTLFALLISAIVIGIILVSKRYFIFTDGAIYATIGRNIAQGYGLTYGEAINLYFPPGYPLAIALLYFFTWDAELAAHLVSLFGYVISVILLYVLAYNIRQSLGFAALAALMLLFHPTALYLCSVALSESLFLSALLGSALCSWQLAARSRPPYWLWLLWAVLGAFLYHIRADGILYLPLQGLYILFFGQLSWRPRIFRLLLSGVLACLLTLPYLYTIKHQTGQWQLSTKTAILLEYSHMHMQKAQAKTLTDNTAQIAEDGQHLKLNKAQTTFASLLFETPGTALERVLLNLKTLMARPDIAFHWINILVLLLLLIPNPRVVFSPTACFIWFHLAPIGLFLLLYIDQRFVISFVPFFALAWSRAIEKIANWAWPFIQRKPAIQYIFLFALILGGIAFSQTNTFSMLRWKAYNLIFRQHDLPLEHKRMGQWMKDNLDITETTRISHRNPWVSFYANGLHVRTGYSEEWDTVLQWLRNNEIEYLIVDDRMTRHFYPAMAFLRFFAVWYG